MRTSPEWNSLSDHQRTVISSHQTNLPVAVGAIAKDLGLTILKSTMPGSISGEIRETGGLLRSRLIATMLKKGNDLLLPMKSRIFATS